MNRAKALLVVLLLPLATAQASSRQLYIGDKVILNTPGIAPGDRIVMYHVADAILSLQETGLYHTIIVGVGTHAVQGSDKPYAGHPDLFQRRYRQLLTVAQTHGRHVVVVNIPWLNWASYKIPRAQRWNAIIATEAGSRGICVADAWTVMRKCGRACISKDGYHPSATGYARIKTEVDRCLK